MLAGAGDPETLDHLRRWAATWMAQAMVPRGDALLVWCPDSPDSPRPLRLQLEDELGAELAPSLHTLDRRQREQERPWAFSLAPGMEV